MFKVGDKVEVKDRDFKGVVVAIFYKWNADLSAPTVVQCIAVQRAGGEFTIETERGLRHVQD